MKQILRHENFVVDWTTIANPFIATQGHSKYSKCQYKPGHITRLRERDNHRISLLWGQISVFLSIFCDCYPVKLVINYKSF